MSPAGTLVLCGGSGLSLEGKPSNLIAQLVREGPLVVMTCASEEPTEAWAEARNVFSSLGVKDIAHIDVRDRTQKLDAEQDAKLRDAKGVFFTGGDQLKIVARMGNTPVYDAVRRIADTPGRVVAGGSAGASVMSDTMLVDGKGEDTLNVRDAIRMAPGLGLLLGYIVDVHFSERGRIGRLVAAVAQNPAVMGMGIDEGTAIAVRDGCADVVGDGAVWFIDGSQSANSNIAEDAEDETLSIENVVVHVLADGRQFDMINRRPA